MLELDQVVRQNQLVCLPYAKSGKAEAELFEAYPELPGIIETNKRAKIASMAQRSQYHEESRPGDSSKSRATSTDNSVGAPQSRAQSGSSMEKGILFKSPSLKSQSSNTDLMFEMDEGETMGTPVSDEMTTSELDHPLPSSSLTFHKQHDAVAVSMSPSLFDDQIQHRNPESSSQQGTTASSSSAKAWGLSALNPSKLDMKDIMAQASLNRVSNISSGLSIQAHSSGPSVGSPARLSQRERRKKQQQQQMQETLSEPLPASVGLDTNSHQPSSPWQVTPRGQKFSLEDVVRAEDKSSSPRNPIRTSSNPPLTMRQTVAGNSTTAKRTGSSSKSPQSLSAARSNTAPPLSHPSKPASSVVPIRSVTHQPRPVEPSLQLSMADILSQQQSEKDIIRDAAAKRSLQEIQEEQAFQEWWDQESRKVMMEEEQEQEQAAAAAQAGRGRGRGRGKGRGRRRERGR